MNKFLLFCISVVFIINCSSKCDKNSVSGPYLGQTPPIGTEAKIFAPGIVSNGMDNRDITFMPDGKEIYFCAYFGGFNYNAILYAKQKNDGTWTDPEVAPFSTNTNYMDFEPCISPDGNHLYFLSNRPDLENGETEIGDQDIWVVDRVGDGWGEPYNLGEPVNSENEEYYPSVTEDGTMYFTRQDKGSPIGFIYRSKFVDGKYQEPEKLPEQVNCARSQFNAFVSPDEDYIIVPAAAMENSLGGVDYYISFRNENDEWSEPQNIGEPVNSDSRNEWSASISPDGKYLFFMSSRTPVKPENITYDQFKSIFNSTANGSSNIYWVSSTVIENLRPAGF